MSHTQQVMSHGQLRVTHDLCTTGLLPPTAELWKGFAKSQSPQQLLYINVQRFRGGLVSKAHTLLYHSTLCSRVIKKKKESPRMLVVSKVILCLSDAAKTGYPVQHSGVVCLSLYQSCAFPIVPSCPHYPHTSMSIDAVPRVYSPQGYLAHEKTLPPPRTTIVP